MPLSEVEETQQAHQKQRPKWTLAHGFYAYMGGFAIDSKLQDLNAHEIPLVRVTVNLELFQLLIKCRGEQLVQSDQLMGDTPAHQQKDNEKPVSSSTNDWTQTMNVCSEELSDRSKTNGLEKSIICLQALWFCIQCVVRLAQRLPLSLLEVNTAVHALAALAVYILWWHKPLDIELPTALRMDDPDKVQFLVRMLDKYSPCFQNLKGKPCTLKLRIKRKGYRFEDGTSRLVPAGGVEGLERFVVLRYHNITSIWLTNAQI